MIGRANLKNAFSSSSLCLCVKNTADRITTLVPVLRAHSIVFPLKITLE
jgi:hypothetical protein